MTVAELIDEVSVWLRDHDHVWIAEQQTDHRVCAWCNTCEGGCCP